MDNIASKRDNATVLFEQQRRKLSQSVHMCSRIGAFVIRCLEGSVAIDMFNLEVQGFN